ncbi:hypothetical protein CEXT_690131 [Caerostris extrusa]|uniref:Tudor domain-containing protein n=1 Tax=Caerostris extrusa TaxID=172846 RepID=A0AAV4PS21_CAEEX|nr:hypothetical protein CEXT_690131 [Caerostris extrusa]
MAITSEETPAVAALEDTSASSIVSEDTLAMLYSFTRPHFCTSSFRRFWTLKDFTDSLTSTCDHFPPPNMPYVKEGDVCVYRRDDFNFWCRTKVLNVLENGVAAIRFLDYGGYLIVPVQTLKQIPSEYLRLPFQAVECHVYDILPADSLQWSQQCQQEVHRLVFASSNAVLRVVVLGYNGEVPIVQVLYAPYAPHNDLSRHLISVGLARSMTVCARSTGALQFHCAS